MNAGKIGTIFIISIMALAGIGISFAQFIDSIDIVSQVNSWCVDVEFSTHTTNDGNDELDFHLIIHIGDIAEMTTIEFELEPIFTQWNI